MGYGFKENPPEAKFRLEHVDGDKFTLDNFNYDLSSMGGVEYFKLTTDNGSVTLSTNDDFKKKDIFHLKASVVV